MEFNLEPYWDDFAATNGALENNYMRILFRPGYAVQARELTQIQSIIQNQIKQFGDHIFKDGSPVIGGHLTVDTGVTYLKLQRQDESGQDIDLENFLGVVTFNNVVPRTRAKVLQTFESSTDRTLMIRYLRGPGFTSGEKILTAAGFTANLVSSATVSDYTGKGSTVSINSGVFYVNGFFVNVLPQTIVLEPYSSSPTYRIGLEIDENIVTESMDNALLDPAQESFNYQAPGAHRYQFTLNLAKRKLNSVDDRRFFELLRIEDGVITKQVSYPIYSELEKTLARRTYDESGNYEVKPFMITLSANTPAGLPENTSTFIVNIEPGKAYVKGFEFETIGTTKISADRARTFNSNKNYDLSIYYGNKIYVNDLKGSANGLSYSDSTLSDVDIHIVKGNNVSLSGFSANYYATRIGTAKIRNIDRVAGNNYQINLTDLNFNPIIAAANATTNTTAITFGAHFSPTNNAYQNCTITIINNYGSNGNVSRITSYDGTTKTAFISPPIKTTMLRGSVFSITAPPAFANSVVVLNTASSFASANLTANIAPVGVGRDVRGNTIFEDSSYDKMLFEIPNSYIKYDSDRNVLLYRRRLKTESFTVNGAATISLTGETINYGTDGSLLSVSDRNENIIVVAKTGANAGQIIDLTVGDRNVYRTDSTTLTIYTSNGSGTAFTGDIYLTTKLTNANGSYRRVKTLTQSNSVITAGDTLSSATSVIDYSEVKINATNATVWFTSSNVISKIPGEPISLFLSDVVKINRIYDSGNVSHAPNTTNAVDITDRFLFDGGQTDNYYDHATITLRPGSKAPTGQTVVFLDYYTHTGSGYISQKSYSNTVYENEQIPIYKSQTGKLNYLRDCIDMRPLRASGVTATPFKTIALGPKVNISQNGFIITANNSLSQNTLSPPLISGSIVKINGEYRTIDKIENLTEVRVNKAFNTSCTNGAIELVTNNLLMSGGILQNPTEQFNFDYEYYLPRIDKIVATKEKEFKIIQGVPSLNPSEPIEPEDSMPIYTLHLPPYTGTLKSVDPKRIENRRYTMKDISLIDKRVAQIEEYVKLKETEKNIIVNPPKSPETPTINKPIYGTIVDEFNDFSVADMSPAGQFRASIEKGVLSCLQLATPYSLEPSNDQWSYGTAADGTNFKTDKCFMLRYTETPFTGQKLYSVSGVETVQTAIIAKYEGFVDLTPERDYFYSQIHKPSASDAYARFIETLGTDDDINNNTLFDPKNNNNKIENIGGGGYEDSKYNEPILIADQSPARLKTSVLVPDWSSEPLTTYTPEYTEVTTTESLTSIPATSGLINVTQNMPDAVVATGGLNLTTVGLAVGDAINVNGDTRYINFISPSGLFITVNVNFNTTVTGGVINDVAISETFTQVTGDPIEIYEPSVLREIPIDFTAIMPETYLNDIWAPPPVEQIPVEIDQPVFAPAWMQETIIAPSIDVGFDSIYSRYDDFL